MNPDSDTALPSPYVPRDQAAHSGRRSLPPAFVGPHHAFPSYPSSTLQYYFPPPHHVASYAHILSSPHADSLRHPDVGNFPHIPLPSASQSHLPSLRCSPSFHSTDNVHIQNVPGSPFFDHPNNFRPRSSQRIQSLSPIAFAQPQGIQFAQPQPLPFIAAPQPMPLPHDPVIPPYVPLQRPQVVNVAPQTPNPPVSYVNSTLPSTKDVPILTGKHDWGPWHASVRALILNANLLGHIADDPLPGAVFDPGLWPTYPPTVHQQSSLVELQAFADWWSRDGLASHILTSRLSPSVLGSLPIPNERMGQRRSARTVYLTLWHQYGAGDYSAVMVIEARLRQLRCLPTRGGTRVPDFISTWRVSINQMEAAGFLPGSRQLLSMFADGLPTNTVAFVNLYDSIMFSLNDSDDRSLPNLQHLFDRVIHIDNNIQRNRILHASSRRSQQPAPPSSYTPTPVAAPATDTQTPASR